MITQEMAKIWYDYDLETGALTFRLRDVSTMRPCIYSRHVKMVGKEAGGINSEGYRVVLVNKKYCLAHRLIWLMMTGVLPKYPEFEIDHINGIRTDNRWCNLRLVTKSENQRNHAPRKNNTSGFHGVNWKPKYNKKPGDGRWVARIWDGPRHLYLGSFHTKEEAFEARLAAEKRLGYVVRR